MKDRLAQTPFDLEAYNAFKRAAAMSAEEFARVSIPMDETAPHNPLEQMRAALMEAERFMSYFAGETGGHFVGCGTPTTCLAQIRAALQPDGYPLPIDQWGPPPWPDQDE